MNCSGVDEFDVVIVGLGAAAMAAAITVHDGGGRAVLLEKAPPELSGGNTRVSGQVWFSPRDVEQAVEHLHSLAQGYVVDDDLASAWARGVSGNNAWMRARVDEVAGKVEWDPRDPYQGDGTDITSVPYAVAMGGSMGDLTGATANPSHEFPEIAGNECGTEWNYIGPTQGFSRLWLTLRACVDLRGIEIRFENRATRLVQGESGRVTGVDVETPEGLRTIHSRRGVVLACGGFENNPQMVRDYLRLERATPWGSPSNTGDGHKMAMKAGADLSHMHNFMATIGAGIEDLGQAEWVQPVENRFILVGADGKRFMDDATPLRHGKALIRGGFEPFPGFEHYMIFDSAALAAGPIVLPVEGFAGGWMKQVLRYEWSEGSESEIAKGWIASGATVEELAHNLGVDPDGLRVTVAEFNDACDRGCDERFGRPAETLHPLREGPYYGYRWNGALINTLGGPRKNGRAQVVDALGEPIPGLYCAGEISATTTWMLEGGQSIGDALAFGRIAGRSALGSEHA